MKDKIKIYFVTANESKYVEAKEVFSRYGLSLDWYRLEVDEIQSKSLMEIVVWKGHEIMKIIDEPFIVEDTGLFIKSLNGFPGPFSSYVYKTIGNDGILNLMRDIDDREAHFISYGLLYLGNGAFKIFKVDVKGRICGDIRGDRGFGFDPIFIPEGSDKTYAEMSIEEKNRYSHRGLLFKEIADYIVKNGLIAWPPNNL